MPKIMMSVGEASGDLHGASVAKEIKLLCGEAQIFGMGGDRMREAGVKIVYDIKDLGVIGIVEVVKNLPKFFKLRDKLAQLMDEERPDALIVIDYPGFNTRLAKVAKKKGIPIVSYISPSAWAWGRGRAKEVAETVDKVAAIFPFEAKIYEEAGAKVAFVGHPLLDIVKPSMEKAECYRYFGADPEKTLALLMPGSRAQEIETLLEPMLAAGLKIREQIPDCQFYLPLASTIERETVESKIERFNAPVRITTDKVYDLMNISQVAIAASGTAVLEISLMRVPSVIIYKVAALTYCIGKLLVKIPHIGLPNIIAGRKILPEILQSQISGEIIAQETLLLLQDSQRREQALKDLDEVRLKLGESGAVKKVARIVLEVAGQKKKTLT